MSYTVLGIICFLCGLGGGWLLWRNERTYQEGWRDGERYGRAEGFRTALKKLSQHNLLNPRTGDWYDK